MEAGSDAIALGLLFLTALLVGFSGALTPGPILTYVVAESARHGHWTGPRVVLGHVLLEIALVVAIALGLGQILAAPAATSAIGLIGGAMLIWMGRRILAGVVSGRLSLSLEADRSARGAGGPIAAGVILSASNPYFILWWATIGLSYITAALRFGAFGLGIFYAGHALSDLTWYWGVSGLVGAGRRYVNQTLYRGVLALCGVFLIGLALYFISESIRLWTVLA
ncbi:MAG TPA: LysE family transporter [Dehalococcoidia bacterium]|nr:LysE family transporter [Dehalococcoidia bacterium]